MPDTVHAVASENFTLANTETSYLAGAIIKDMPVNQHADLVAVGFVRKEPATAEEIASADAPPPVIEAVPTDEAPAPMKAPETAPAD